MLCRLGCGNALSRDSIWIRETCHYNIQAAHRRAACAALSENMLLFLLSLLGLVPTFQKSKCKKLLKITMARIQLLRSRRETQLRQLRRDVAQLLQLGKEQKAQIWLGRIWKEVCLLSVYKSISDYCALVRENLTNIAGQRECPTNLAEPLASLCFAASCCADLPELQELRKIFAMKYGQRFVTSAQELQPECCVNRELLNNFSAKGLSDLCKKNLLKEIAEEYELMQEHDQDTLQQGLLEYPRTEAIVDSNEQNELEVQQDGMDQLTEELDVEQETGDRETAAAEEELANGKPHKRTSDEEVCSDDENHAEISNGLHDGMNGHGQGHGYGDEACNNDVNHVERIETTNGNHTCIQGYDDVGSLQARNTAQMMPRERKYPFNQHHPYAEVSMTRAYHEPNESDTEKQIQLYVEQSMFSRPPQRPPPPPPPPKRPPPPPPPPSPPPPLRIVSMPSQQTIANPPGPNRSSTLENNRFRERHAYHVHPRLPEYEDLVANFVAMRH